MVVHSPFLRTLLLAGAVGLAVPIGAQSPNYVLHKVVDKHGSGDLAMTFEVPKGWVTQDNVRWDLNLRLNPMSYLVSTGNPDGKSWISYLSGLTFDFATNGAGGMAGKMPPAHASDFLLDDVRTTHPGVPFQVVDQQNVPISFPFHPTAAGVIAIARHSTVTVRFQESGGSVLEKLSYDFYGYSQPTGGGASKGNWFVSGLTVVNAPEGQLAAVEQVCTHVLQSERMTTAFQARYQQVSQMLLAKTRAEGIAEQQQRARRIISGGGVHGRAMDKDEFIMHEEIKGLRSQLFSRSIGN